MLGIFLGEQCLLNWYAPINAEGVILDADATIVSRGVIVVALVLEDSCLRENGETVGKSTRDEELTMIVFCQFYCYMLAECRRAFTDINGYVEDCALDTAHEFALSIWHALIMQSSHHAV